MSDSSSETLAVELPVDAAVLKERTQRALDRGHRDLIALRCLLVGSVYMVLSVLNYLSFNTEIGITLAVMALLTAILFLSFALYHRMADYPPLRADWFLFLEAVILQIDGMAFLVLTNDIMNSYGVFVMMLGVGIFVSQFRWLVISMAFITVSWFATLYVFSFSIQADRELLSLASSIIAAGFFYYLRMKTLERITYSQIAQESYQHQLEQALQQIETLSGLLPICAGCKNIRDEGGHWHEVETYVRDHSKAEFTHSLCPNCVEEYYPGQTPA